MNSSENNSIPRLYNDLAWLWPLWESTDDYREYSKFVTRLIRDHEPRPLKSALVISCGSGKMLFNLKREFNTTGLDISPTMLDYARKLNPDTQFIQGDMRNFKLDTQYDIVYMDDGFMYMSNSKDVKSALNCAYKHLVPGGLFVSTLDCTVETFEQDRCTVSKGTEVEGQPDVTFIENIFDPDTTDENYEATIVYLIRENGSLSVESETHLMGLFSMDYWRKELTRLGLVLSEYTYIQDGANYPTFIGFKPLK